jgi:single-stranded DNA-specific DHH superfamily exonuclease
MLTESEIKDFRNELDTCKRPIIFFHDDPDGLCSFLLLYKYVGDGIGITIKTPKEMGIEFAKKVKENNCDKVFVLDKADVSQDFFDEIKLPKVWIDHHPPIKRDNVKYFNPRINNPDINHPVSYLCYQATQKNMWISMVGCTGDWMVPNYIEEIKKNYPDLIDKDQNKPEDILFNSKFGKLARIFSFCLKGKMDEVKKCIKIMTRIKTPYELLNCETPGAKFVYKKFEKIEIEYQETLNQAISKKTDDELLLYTYESNKMSLNQDISNELLYKFPEKVIVIGRKRNSELKLSLRANNYILPELLKKALAGCDGAGGGHEHASGANVKIDDFDKFLEQFKSELKG